jgi:hypothetical protein
MNTGGLRGLVAYQKEYAPGGPSWTWWRGRWPSTLVRHDACMAWEGWLSVAGDVGSAVGGIGVVYAVITYRSENKSREVAALQAVREVLWDLPEPTSTARGTNDFIELQEGMRRLAQVIHLSYVYTKGENRRALQDLAGMIQRWEKLGVRGHQEGWLQPLNEYIPQIIKYLSNAADKKRRIKRPQMPAWFIDDRPWTIID